MKAVTYLNLVGVLCLVGLCLAQWGRDRELNLELNRLRREAYSQSSRLEEQAKSSREQTADLGELKNHFESAALEKALLREKLRTAERDLHRLAEERDQFQNSVTQWIRAVVTRDERLKEAAAQIRQGEQELTVSIHKFNTLASNHNGVVKDLNELRSLSKLALPVPTPPPSRDP